MFLHGLFSKDRAILSLTSTFLSCLQSYQEDQDRKRAASPDQTPTSWQKGLFLPLVSSGLCQERRDEKNEASPLLHVNSSPPT